MREKSILEKTSLRCSHNHTIIIISSQRVIISVSSMIVRRKMLMTMPRKIKKIKKDKEKIKGRVKVKVRKNRWKRL